MSRTNNLLRALLLIAGTIILFSCKKDENNSSVFVFSQTTYVFEIGQTQTAQFTKSNVGKVEITEITDGWSAELNSSSVVITAPSTVSTDNESGTIEIKAYGNTTITVTLKVSIQPAEDISAAGLANCYIVSQQSSRYKFKATVKGNDSSQSISPAGAELVWQSSKSLLNYIVYDNGYIMFSTSETDTFGNGVIAALDKNDNVIWSWHIWFTDYQPEQSSQTYSNSLVFMDRNLGAYGCDTSSVEEIWKSYGLLYQWGRKDPFVGPKSYNTTVNQSMYDADDKWLAVLIEQTSDEIGTIEYAVANPRTYITGVDESDYDWLYDARDNSLWGGESGSKSIYDPCPYGWKVPPQDAWSEFTSTGEQTSEESEFNVDGTYNYGWMFKYDGEQTTFYPAAGRRSFSAGSYTNVDPAGYDPMGFYWSNSANGQSPKLASSMNFAKDMISPVTGLYRAGGHSIRCVKQ